MLADFVGLTLPFYGRILLLLFALVLPVHFAVSHLLGKRVVLLGKAEAFLIILLSVLSIWFYFALKSLAASRGYVSLIPSLEGPVWEDLLLPAIGGLANRYSALFGVLDRYYFSVWGITCALAVPALFLPRRIALEFYTALISAYVVTAPIYLVLPTESPFYLFREAFSFLNGTAPISARLHLESERVTRLLLYAVPLREIVETVGYPFQPVAAFPSFHVTYAYIVGKTFERIAGRNLLLGHLFAGTMGLSAILLGFHWICDVVAGWLLGCVLTAFCRIREEKPSRSNDNENNSREVRTGTSRRPLPHRDNRSNRYRRSHGSHP